MTTLTPAEYGRQLAQAEPPISDGQAEAAARVLATAVVDEPHARSA